MTRRDMNLIASYLARRDPETLSEADADVLVLCGSAVLAAVETAAEALHEELVPRVLVAGGVGHSTGYLCDAVRRHPRYRDVQTESRSEAAIIADILRMHHRVPEAAISLEEESTNCGENASFALAVLQRQPQPARSILLIQDPTMQRRTHACFERGLRDVRGVSVSSYAPFVPVVTNGDVKAPDGSTVWSLQRFTALLLGEMRRLHDTEDGYGPSGVDFFDHIDIPSEVMDAYRRLAATHPGSTREAWSP